MADEDKGPWYGRVAEIGAKWLTGQTFNNVLLVAILFGGGYTAVKLVPVHLDQIQRGYTNVIDSFRETAAKDRLAERELIKKMDDDHRQEREFLYQIIQSKKVVAQ